MNKRYPKVSIIVPVFNVEKYLEQCVLSLVKQTYSATEVILVDDGSTDSSGQICDSFAAEYEQVQVIHQKNSGLSSARNTGLKHATGEYVEFVDSDDYVDTNLVRILIESMTKSQAEVGVFKFDRLMGKTQIMIEDPDAKYFPPNQSLTGEETLKCLLKGNVDSHAWRYIASRRLFTEFNITFPEGKDFEDLYTSYKVYGHTKKVVLINQNLYHYRKRSNSILHNVDTLANSYNDAIEAYLERGRILKKWYPNLCSLNDEAFACWLIHLAWENDLKRNRSERKQLKAYVELINKALKQNVSPRLLFSLPPVFIVQYFLIKSRLVYPTKVALQLTGHRYTINS